MKRDGPIELRLQLLHNQIWVFSVSDCPNPDDQSCLIHRQKKTIRSHGMTFFEHLFGSNSDFFSVVRRCMDPQASHATGYGQ
jgi:hypothetical protein